MKKMRKLQLAALLLGVSVAVAGFAVMNENVRAQADGTATFAMETGATVRTDPEKSGIRWITTVSESWYNANVPAGAKVAFGTFVTSADNISSVEELDENFNNGKKDISCPSAAKFKDGAFTYYSSVAYNNVSADKQKAAYAEELVARSYVKYSTDKGSTWTYVYADAEDTMRCVRVLAATAIEDKKAFAALPTDEDRNAVKAFVGTNGGELVKDGYLETAEGDVFNASSYDAVYENFKKVDEIKTEFTIGEHYDYLLFDADGNYATARFQYVTQALDNEAEFKATLASAATGTVDGYYALAKDITLTEAWKNSATFSGTLDGNGYAIKDLSVSQKSGLFAALDGATFKNVSMKDATLGGQESGVFAYTTEGKATFDNVYVSIASTAPFGKYYDEETAKDLYGGVLNSNYFKGGLIGCVTDSNVNLSVKNCVVYMPEFLSKAHGFVVGYGNPKLTITGSTFIGGNGLFCGERDGYEATVIKDDYTVVCDAVAAHKTYKANWTKMQISAYDSNHAYVELDNETITTLVYMTKQIVVLTEDITFSTNTWLGSAKNTFSGVFDGQNHTISGLTNSADTAYTGGLFRYFQGSVKNVALKGTLTLYSGGLFADTVQNNAYLENVYFETTLAASRQSYKEFGYSQGGILRYLKESSSLSMKDVVTNVPTLDKEGNSGAVMGYAGKSAVGLYMENCHYIAPKEQPMGDRGDGYVSISGNNVQYFIWDIGDTIDGTTMTVDDGAAYYRSLDLLKAFVVQDMVQFSDFLSAIIRN